MAIKYSEQMIKNLNEAIKEHFPRIVIANPSMKVTHEGVSRMVMLDRYSQKDKTLKTLIKGDLVVAKIKSDPKFPTLGIAYVEEISPKYVTVKVEDEYVGQIDPAYKPEHGVVKLAKTDISKPLEIFYDQIAARVGGALALGETPSVKDDFVKELTEMNIVPAGRVLHGAGSGSQVTFFNCFVMPMPKDSREGLADHRKEVMEIMSRGGGVGTNGSTLRPKNTAAISVGGKSSGAVS